MKTSSVISTVALAAGVVLTGAGAAIAATGPEHDPGMHNPGMERMHELRMNGNPGMERMHELMMNGNPGMAQMHRQMTSSQSMPVSPSN
jgi:hypothetical protein